VHVARIEIRNVKGFGDGDEALELDLTEGGKRTSLAGWTVFAGTNGSGKTTLLQAVALGIDRADTYRAVADQLPDWIHGDAPSGSLKLRLLHQGREAIAHNITVEWKRDPSRSFTRSGGLAPTSRRERDEPPIDAWFMAAYGPSRRVIGRLDDTTDLLDPRAHRSAGLFREDAFLAESVQWLQKLDYRQLAGEAEAKRLLDHVIALLNDDLLPGGLRVLGVTPDGLRMQHRGVELTLQSLSHGYRTTAAFVADLVMHIAALEGRVRFESLPDGRVIVPHPGVVLVDEMELHLHPSWQKKIGFWLKEHFPAVQFLVTTHSPFICQAADTLVRLSPPGEGQPVAEIVDESTYRRVVGGGADDAVVSSLFGLDYPHSDKAERARERLAALEVKEFDGQLTAAERPELEGLRRELPDTPSASVEQALRKVAAAR